MCTLLRSETKIVLCVLAALGAGCDRGDDRRQPDPPIVAPDAGPPPMTTDDAGLDHDAGPAPCVPSCGSAECGADGCGGSCGWCAPDSLCEAGACVVVCPTHARVDGDRCVCEAGFTPDLACSACVPDPELDGCPAHASRSGGACACDDGYVPDRCGCVPDPTPSCPSGEALFCGACIPDPEGDGCPPNASPSAGGCACDPGYWFDERGCTCLEIGQDFTHPAFDPTSCTGAPMTHEEAEARWRSEPVLGSYQLVFRRRTCRDGGCGAWEEVPLGDIPWATSASGVLQITRRGGVMNLDVRRGLCTHHHYLYDDQYNVGAVCTGVGGSLTCGTYHYPGICLGPSTSSEPYLLLGRELRFFGTMTDTCVRLQADVTGFAGGTEAQAALLVRFGEEG